jgi:hypothetical protein
MSIHVGVGLRILTLVRRAGVVLDRVTDRRHAHMHISLGDLQYVS